MSVRVAVVDSCVFEPAIDRLACHSKGGCDVRDGHGAVGVRPDRGVSEAVLGVVEVSAGFVQRVDCLGPFGAGAGVVHGGASLVGLYDQHTPVYDGVSSGNRAFGKGLWS